MKIQLCNKYILFVNLILVGCLERSETNMLMTNKRPSKPITDTNSSGENSDAEQKKEMKLALKRKEIQMKREREKEMKKKKQQQNGEKVRGM